MPRKATLDFTQPFLGTSKTKQPYKQNRRTVIKNVQNLILRGIIF